MFPRDFDCIGDVAVHCDLKKLCIAVDEALQFDIIPLFCYDFVKEILENFDSEEEKWKRLLGCGSYEWNGRSYLNMGFKRVWVYYSYARYLLINQMNDTANGTVRKNNEFSLPTPLKEVTDFSNKYRSMGREAYESVKEYLCRVREDYEKFDDCGCPKVCGCKGACSCGKTKKLTGVRFKTISGGF
ncbi:DUF6712 family protein [Cruoricaptor ignavus]|uniref:DUF6712 family protein n=1 Tax=Cruoricaptor ignavus TaxID=1118202 RepID=UPI0013566BD2|nr:hypothetical protein [Cruoricaptor ignavus]